MSERFTLVETLGSIREFSQIMLDAGKIIVGELVARIDTRYADAINGPLDD